MLNEPLFGERLINAKNGYTILAGNTTLHSRYNPADEAEKYIHSLSLKNYNYFILPEPGLGYLAAALKKKFPESKIITLHCSSFFNNKNNSMNGIDPAEDRGLSWSPLSLNSLEEFLEKNLYDTDAADIKLIEWKPSVDFYGKNYLDLVSRTVECIRVLHAGKRTAHFFGKRWLRNALKNLSMMQSTVTAAPGSVPVLVCAAGPSLEDAMEEIALWANGSPQPLLMAVSSAASALLYRGIKPGIVIATDGGLWAQRHLLECTRYYKKSSDSKPVYACSVTALIPSQVKDSPVLFMCDGSLWQKILLNTIGVTYLTFPQRGTVALSALDLAFTLSNGSIFICGMDFRNRDLITHARPYAFDSIPEQNQSRKKPLYSEFFERQEMIKNGGSHKIYSAWLKSHLGEYTGRLYSPGTSQFGIPAGKPDLSNNCKSVSFNIKQRNLMTGKDGLIETLANALDNPAVKDQLGRELGEMLLPNIPKTDKKFTGELKKALLGLADG